MATIQITQPDRAPLVGFSSPHRIPKLYLKCKIIALLGQYLPVRSHQAPIPMGVCARLTSAKLTLLSRFSATSGATDD